MCAWTTDEHAAGSACHIAKVLRGQTDFLLIEDLPDEITQLLVRLKEIDRCAAGVATTDPRFSAYRRPACD